MNSRNLREIAQFDALPDSAFVRIGTVCALFGNVTRSCIFRWIKTEGFPAPHRIGPQVSAWRVADLREFQARVVDDAA